MLNGSTLDKLQRTYAWGVDIAGSLADAVGVGALLQFANSTTGTAFMPSYDGNGNIASLINLGSGALAGAFEYSPFGEMLRDETLDNAVATFGFKFSTKWRDAETGWSNYGRRYYDPSNGRFIGRDPIAEEGGINLYAFCENNPDDRWDYLGMIEVSYKSSPSIDSSKLLDGVADLEDGSDEDESLVGKFQTKWEIENATKYAAEGLDLSYGEAGDLSAIEFSFPFPELEGFSDGLGSAPNSGGHIVDNSCAFHADAGTNARRMVADE